MEQVRGHFRPEFLNRIDEIILFRRLGRDQMAGIVRIQMARFEKLLADRRLTLSLDDSAYAWLADKGYDPVYGARPLKRVIQKDLVDPVAKKLLAGEIEERVRALTIPHAGSDVAPVCTVSIGVAATSPAVETLQDLLALADAELYRARMEGHGRVSATDHDRPTLMRGHASPVTSAEG
jgi:GGDEF domain-containing protein